MDGQCHARRGLADDIVQENLLAGRIAFGLDVFAGDLFKRLEVTVRTPNPKGSVMLHGGRILSAPFEPSSIPGRGALR